MLTYSFEHIGKDSLYEYLYKCIKHDILDGTLPPDYKLPSKRTFAKNLNVSTITIENAYAQLIAEGYLYSLPKKGYYVADIAAGTFAVTPVKAQAPVQAPQNMPLASGTPDILTYAKKEQAQETAFFSFSSHNANVTNFPFFTWSKLMKEVMTGLTDEVMTPSPAEGVYRLRAAIAQHLFDFRGMRVSPEQIIIGAGTEYLYGLLIQLLGQQLTFAVEDPGYSKIRLIYESHGVKCRCVPLDHDGINIPSLEQSHADILHLSPSHHYPTGIVTPISRRYELLGWALKEENRFIIEDDYDCEFRLQGRPIPSLQSIDVSDKVIYMNTFTKSLTSTIRISYMVLPIPLMQRFRNNLGFYSCTVSNFEQYTLARFIEEKHFEKHINRMRLFYRKQRDLLIAAIENSPLKSCVTIQEKDAGLHFLLKVDTSISDERLTQKAKEAGLLLTCLSKYYYNQTYAIAHTIIVNYSALEQDKIPEAIDRLYRCIISASQEP